MNKSIANTVRAAFALFMLGIGMYAGVDTLVAHDLANRGLSTCGSAENPCALAPLHVAVSPVAAPAHKSGATVRAVAGAPSAPRSAMAES
ncbi:MAG TPA: hypothetical protein VF092_14575 [Longimicrobium sp.]